MSRTPPGVRELKLAVGIGVKVIGGRTPPGVRELKHANARIVRIWDESHPSRGA